MIDWKKLASAALVLVAAVSLAAGVALGAEYPTTTIKVVVPYPPGGTGDVVARILAEKASADLGKPIIIDNRSGANGVIGAEFVAHAKPDGYTVLMMATQHVILPSLQADMPYDLQHDFTPVFGVNAVPMIFVVNATSKVRTLADLVDLAKATPGGLNYSSGGTGSLSHLVMARLAHDLGFAATHVPFRGFAPAIQALLGDQVQFTSAGIADFAELIKAGNLRAISVAALQRLPELPDVPTMAEAGYKDFEAASWNAYLVPAHTPPQVADRLVSAYAKAARDLGVLEHLRKIGVVMTIKTGAEVSAVIREEGARWRKVVEENHITMGN